MSQPRVRSTPALSPASAASLCTEPSILLGATWVSLLGVVDDRWGLRPVLKLIGQVVGAIILILAGVQVQFLSSETLNWAVTIIWVVGLTNAINFLDNMDGLSGGIAAIASAF
jgi:UDP-GlcNAc:undecaprenyl-phosphate GlcNAc-1-phosphate transferase